MPPPKLQCPVDGHVHFHSLDRVEPTLNAAAAHFRALGERTEGLLGALLLTQTSGERVFESLQGERQAGSWTIAAASASGWSAIHRTSTGGRPRGGRGRRPSARSRRRSPSTVRPSW